MTGSAPAFLWVVAGIAFVIAAVLALLVTSALPAYETALWTLTIRSLTVPTRVEDIS